jgi:hypothetical protein
MWGPSFQGCQGDCRRLRHDVSWLCRCHWYQEMHQHKQEACSDHEGLLGKFAWNNKIIDKKFVQLDTELEKVVDLVGEKIKKEVGDIAHDFGEAMEIEEAWRASSEAKTVNLEARLEEALGHIANLASLVTNLQG